MYSIRTFTKDGVETNEVLGNSYKVFKLTPELSYGHITNDGFCSKYEEVLGDIPEDFDNRDDLPVAFVQGDSVSVLYRGQEAYIVSPNGSTYSKIKVN